MGLNERKKVGLVIAAAVGIAAIAVLVLIAYPAYQQNQKYREEMEAMDTVIENGRHGTSIFNLPVTKINGTTRPLYPDTSEKQIIFFTRENFTREAILKYVPVGNSLFGNCGGKDGVNDHLGEDNNPVIAKIGSKVPVTLTYCINNLFTLEPRVYLLQIKQEPTDDGNPSYDNIIKGLEFKLNTRTMDLPPFAHRDSSQNPDFGNVTLVMERIHLDIMANSDAKEGVHIFVLGVPPLDTESTGVGIGGNVIYVKVIR